MYTLANTQQKEIYSSNHISNYIAAALSHHISTPQGIASLASQSLLLSPLLFQSLISGEKIAPTPESSGWTNSVATEHENDYHTSNKIRGITNTLLLNLLQQSTVPNSLV
jgi:hypothetical protein